MTTDDLPAVFMGLTLWTSIVAVGGTFIGEHDHRNRTRAYLTEIYETCDYIAELRDYKALDAEDVRAICFGKLMPATVDQAMKGIKHEYP